MSNGLVSFRDPLELPPQPLCLRLGCVRCDGVRVAPPGGPVVGGLDLRGGGGVGDAEVSVVRVGLVAGAALQMV